jgi:hypothetical protein
LSQPLFGIALAIALLAFAWTIGQRARLLLAARPANRFDHFGERVRGTVVYGFGPDQPLGPPFFLARDLLEASVIVGVSYMLYRRLIIHTPRLFGIGAAEERYRKAPHWWRGGCTT